MKDRDEPKATRRKFLTAAASTAAVVAGPAALAGNPKNLPPNVPEWTRVLGDGVAVRPYGKPSKYEANVIRRDVSWLTASRESSVSFTPLHELDGIITPSGLCFERHHSGIAEIDPEDYRLIVHGLVEKDLIFTLAELKRFPRVNRIYFLECAANSGMEWRGAQLNGCQYTHGMVHCVEYTGVPLRALLAEAGVKPSAKWLLAEGADSAAMSRSIPIEKALDDCLVAYRMNGEMLRPEQGYPARLVVPGWEGNVWVKWLRRLKLGDAPWFAREETSKYTRPDGGRQSAPLHVRDGREVDHHVAVAAGAGARQGLHGDLGACVVRPRQDQARRRLARRRAQLARGAARRARARQGLCAFLCRDRMGWQRNAAAVARNR